MILLFIILIILFLLSLFILILSLSNLEIEINKFNFENSNDRYRKNGDYLIYIRIKLLNKITWFKIKIDNNKINNIKKSKIFNSKISNKFKFIIKPKEILLEKDIIRYIKELYINIKRIELNIELSMGNTILTSFAVVTISTIISIILARGIDKYNKRKCNYKIMPIYKEKPSIKIKLNCIISIKMIHIINIIYMLIKKRSVDNNGRTSNTRTYVCSNE